MRYVDPKILERVNVWLTPFFDEETQQKIKDLIAFEPKTLDDSFYASPVILGNSLFLRGVKSLYCVSEE